MVPIAFGDPLQWKADRFDFWLEDEIINTPIQKFGIIATITYNTIIKWPRNNGSKLNTCGTF